MNKTFTLGAVTGISAIALAFPVLAQVPAGAATGDDVTVPPPFEMRKPDTSVEGIQSMIDRHQAFLDNVDALVSAQKASVQSLIDDLTAALALTDDDARQEAVRAAHEEHRAAREAALAEHPDLKMLLHAKGRKHGHGPKGGMLAEKLGMTPEELRSEIESGKTIERIAEEKGVALPTPPMGGRGMFRLGASSEAAAR